MIVVNQMFQIVIFIKCMFIRKKTSARKVVLLFPMVEKLKEIHYTNADDIDISPYQTDMNNVENAVKSMKLF